MIQNYQIIFENIISYTAYPINQNATTVTRKSDGFLFIAADDGSSTDSLGYTEVCKFCHARSTSIAQVKAVDGLAPVYPIKYILCAIFLVDVMFDLIYYGLGGMQHERFSKITGSGA